MSTVKIKNKEYDLKFTFNSFKYMGDIDFSLLEQAETKPFIIAQFLDTLLMGAVNHSPKQFVKPSDISEYLEEYVSKEDADINGLFTELMELLQHSNFFKTLQKETK